MRTIIRKCNQEDYPKLVGIWEDAVRQSHKFLDEETISDIKSQLAPAYFPHVDLSVICSGDTIAGFIGLSAGKIEMLFISPEFHGRGFGTRLVSTAIGKGIRLVDVNEQNPEALEFYKRRGFKIISRDENDDAGRPFPILHLSLD